MRRFALAACLLVAVAAFAQQQTRSPHIAYVFPAGCQAGTTVEVKVGGQFLQGVTAAIVSGQGVEVTVGAYDRPIMPNQAQMLVQKLQEARQKLLDQGMRPGPLTNPLAMVRIAKEAGITDDELRALQRFRKERTDPKRQQNPQIAETVTLQIKVASGADEGTREIRLLSPLGLTDPVLFQVGRLPETIANRTDDAFVPTQLDRLPVLVNGQILPGEVHRYVVNLPKGRTIVFAAGARDLTPYIADAVPGWFQAILTLYDANGREVASSDHNLSYQDPVLAYTAPQAGQYAVEIRDELYRGREDFVYRLRIGELPFVTGVFPLGGRLGSTVSLQVSGWNLPAATATAEVAGSARVFGTDVPLATGSLPEVTEKEPNDDDAHAQTIAIGCMVNGRIGKRGDVDAYRIRGKAGEHLVVEVTARRLGSPLDSVLQLTDAHGRALAANDDTPDPAAATITHQADSYVRTVLPKDGAYFVTIRDVQGRGGQLFAYRLRISEPLPDFELRVVPSGVTARAGTTIKLEVFAIRRDGFDGDIKLNLVGAPDGFLLGGATIPGSTDHVPVTLTVPGTPADAPFSIRIAGVAEVGGREIRREALPADEMMQAFAYQHLVPRRQMLVAVTGRANRGLNVIVPDTPVRLVPGTTVKVRLRGLGLAAPRLRLALASAPEGVTFQGLGRDADGPVLTLVVAATVKPGLRGNLLFEASLEPLNPPTTSANQTGAKRPNRPQRFSIGYLPAVPFETVQP